MANTVRNSNISTVMPLSITESQLSLKDSAFTSNIERIASHVQRSSTQVDLCTLTWQTSHLGSQAASSDLSFTSTYRQPANIVGSIWSNAPTSSLTHKYGITSSTGSEQETRNRLASARMSNSSGQMADPMSNDQVLAYISYSESLTVIYASKTAERAPNLSSVSSWIETTLPRVSTHSRSTQSCCGMQESKITFHGSPPTSSEISFTFSHSQSAEVDDPTWKSNSIIVSKTNRNGFILTTKSEPFTLQRPELTDSVENPYRMTNARSKEQAPTSISRVEDQAAPGTSTTLENVPTELSMHVLITPSPHVSLHLKALTDMPTYSSTSFLSKGLIVDGTTAVSTSKQISQTLALNNLLPISKASGGDRQAHASVGRISLDLDVLDSHLDRETNAKENVGYSSSLHSPFPFKDGEQIPQTHQAQTTLSAPSADLFISMSNSKQEGQASTITTGFSHPTISTDLTHTTSTTLAATLAGSAMSMPIHKKSLAVILGSISSAAVIFCGIFFLHRLCYRRLPHVRNDPTYTGHEQTVLTPDDSQYREISRFSEDS